MTTMRSAPRQGRHVLEDGSRPSFRRIRVRVRVTPGRIAAGAAAILLGVFAAAGTAAGSFAYLNATATTTAGSTITAGTSALTLQQGAGVPASAITLTNTVWNRMLPGDFVGQAITVNNTGDSPLALSTRLSNAIAWNVRVAAGACPATLLTSAIQTTTSTALSTVLAGASTTVCVQAELPSTAANSVQGTAPVVSLVVDGVQVP
ncbi:MAG: hypothetical protein JWP32_2021 [Schumannella sp.]|nr:hypothetical protein [Schumannella sp.]